jgi:hypothetical protein
MFNKHLIHRGILVLLLILITIIVLGCNSKSNKPVQLVNKSDEIQKEKILEIINDISRLYIEKGKPLNNEVKNKISQLINGVTEPNDIATLARICRAFVIHRWGTTDGKREVSNFEVLYEETYWQCVKMLTKNNERSKQQLEWLRETSLLNDIESGMFKAIIEGKQFP